MVANINHTTWLGVGHNFREAAKRDWAHNGANFMATGPDPEKPLERDTDLEF